MTKKALRLEKQLELLLKVLKLNGVINSKAYSWITLNTSNPILDSVLREGFTRDMCYISAEEYLKAIDGYILHKECGSKSKLEIENNMRVLVCPICGDVPLDKNYIIESSFYTKLKSRIAKERRSGNYV